MRDPLRVGLGEAHAHLGLEVKVHGRIVARGMAGASGRGALQRALVEHSPAFGADGALDLVRDSEPLKEHVGPNARVPVEPFAMYGQLTHVLRVTVALPSEATTLKRVMKL